VEHHAAGLDRLAKKERGAGFADAVKEDYREAPLSERERALVDYALKLNDAPAEMVETDLAPLRAAGLSDAEILHGNLVVGYFAFANRLTLGLGVELEEEGLGQ
jgi:uncharacterized peroxidase-related enzyme